jgi:hypothetical protein
LHINKTQQTKLHLRPALAQLPGGLDVFAHALVAQHAGDQEEAETI